MSLRELKKVSVIIRYLHGHGLNLNGFWLGKQLGVSDSQGELTSPAERKKQKKQKEGKERKRKRETGHF